MYCLYIRSGAVSQASRAVTLVVTFLLLVAYFLLVSCMAYTSTLKMEALHSSEMSVNVCRTTQCQIPEASTLHSHPYNNLDLVV
jgi:hypothetical protein